MCVRLISVSEKCLFFLLHVRISIWIDLVGEAPVIDLPRSRDSTPPVNVCPDLATEPQDSKIDNNDDLCFMDTFVHMVG